jgi:hypothetical protein
MRALTFAACFAIAAVVACATAKADDADTMPNDEPIDVNGVRLACTGVGDEAKEDPRWAEFAMRIEFANRNAEYLADVYVSVSDAKGEKMFEEMRCDSPWFLADLPPGKYSISATVEGVTETAKFTAPKSGQSRVVVRFPQLPKD